MSKQRSYLITGGAGFIGSNFAAELLRHGAVVTIFDNFSRPGSEENASWLKTIGGRLRIVQGDIRTDTDLLHREISSHATIHHLAGQVAVTTSVSNPRHDFEANALGTLNVLEC